MARNPNTDALLTFEYRINPVFGCLLSRHVFKFPDYFSLPDCLVLVGIVNNFSFFYFLLMIKCQFASSPKRREKFSEHVR